MHQMFNNFVPLSKPDQQPRQAIRQGLGSEPSVVTSVTTLNL
jgi:hypothetical protein